MANKMLIDATHPEETRVVVLRGNRVEEFDFESASRKQLRGNIYLAKVTRVEPSLQAAFIDYGGNRHGFLAFSEIHPDYYQIPVADRQALLDEESREVREDDEENGNGRGRRRGRRRRGRGAERNRRRDVVQSDVIAEGGAASEAVAEGEFAREASDSSTEFLSGTQDDEIAAAREETGLVSSDDFAARDAAPESAEEFAVEETQNDEPQAFASHEQPQPWDQAPDFETERQDDEKRQDDEERHDEENRQDDETGFLRNDDIEDHGGGDDNGDDSEDDNGDNDNDNGDDDNGDDGDDDGNGEENVESIGGDTMAEVRERAPRVRRHYKIQEVIKRRQVMLVQVVKEERGTKGAALTTYLSLAGRYSVLMPNTARGGGISRKVTSAEDRKKMKEVAEELNVPEGMGVILRTAGANRTKTEIKRDFEYLLRLWENVRDLTLKSTAPTLVYEEGSLIKRSIRDLYHSDIDDIVVEGEPAYREAKDFMRMLMPSHAKNVHLYHDAQPIFVRYGTEQQLDAMFSSTVQLKSGGYIVINQTEALVAIDVNSGRATREHSIEETALKTNMEAAAEIARQLRLRDLAGLIVVDFIDMEESRNNRAVERKMKEALKSDRSRIQVGHISHFGLLEMSRQRIRSSVLESSTEICPLCNGTGHVRSVSSVALQLVRALEETLLKGATHNLIARTRSDVAIYVLNHKRAHLRMLEDRFRVAIAVTVDPTLTGHPPFAIDRGEQVMTLEQAKALVIIKPDSVMPYAEDEEEETLDEIADEDSADQDSAAEDGAEGERRSRRRRGRRGRGGESRREAGPETMAEHRIEHNEDYAPMPVADEADDADALPADGEEREARNGEEAQNGEGVRKRRRGRRGGRRNRRGRGENGNDENGENDGGEQDEASASPEYEARHDEPADREPARHDERETMPPAAPDVSAPPSPDLETKPRRRSTVREPAALAPGDSAPAPDASESAPASPDSTEQDNVDNTDKPRRFGWWSRR